MSQAQKKKEVKKLINVTLRQSVAIIVFKIMALGILFLLLHYFLGVVSQFFDTQLESFNNILLSPVIFSVLRIAELAMVSFFIVGWYFKKYVVREDRIIISRGVVLNRVKIFSIANIESLYLRQSMIQNIFGFGTLELRSPTLDENVLLRNINNPQKHMKLIQSLMPKLEKGNIIPLSTGEALIN